MPWPEIRPHARVAAGALALFVGGAGASMAQRGAAPSVVTAAGIVVYRDAHGQARPLTQGGRDTMPVLSPDGQLVAFVRRTPGDSVETALERTERTEVWLVGADGRDARRLLRGRESDDPKRSLAALRDLAFSPDGRTLYVESEGWVTSGALHAVDVASAAERFVCPSNGFEVLTRGPHRGALLVSQHRYYAHGGSYDGTFIVAPTGRTIALVTREEGPAADRRIAAVRAGRGP